MSDNIFIPTSPREVVSIFEKYGFHPRKGWGQNFLVDKNIAAKIVEAAEIKPGEAVIEIGPGLGALTLPLLEQGANVLALEIDVGLFRLLQDILPKCTSARIMQGDALQVIWQELIENHFDRRARIKLLSNLPYSISSPLLYRLFEERFPFSMAVIMLQSEVAERLVSSPGGDYGSLSVLSQYYTSSKILFRVPSHLFWPRPAVDSALVRLIPRPPLLEPPQEPLFWRLVKGVFKVRRKTMLNGLLHTFPWKKEMAAGLLQASGIDPVRRPETLSVGEFANLSRLIYNKNIG